MKCNSLVLYAERRKVGSGDRCMKPVQTVSWWGLKDSGLFPDSGVGKSKADLIEDGFVVCDGNVIAKVSAEEEPYMGGVSASLNVQYACDKCNQTYFPHLPLDTEGVSKLLCYAVETADYDEAVQRTIAQEMDSRNARREMMERLRERGFGKKK